MDLDDQLAALAAGDLDEATARALRARVAADPALARRLARFERLDELLTGWEAPPMDDGAAGRLTDRVDEALADLDDGPLRAAASSGGPRAPAAAASRDRSHASTGSTAAAAGGGDAGVVDLGAERARRRGIPTWASGAAVAAALTAVVGVGVGSMVVGGSDSAQDAAAPAEESLAGEATDDAGDEAEFSDEMTDDEMADEMTESAPATGAGTATMAGPRLEGVDLAEGELDRLVTEDPDDLGAQQTSALRLESGAATSEGAEDDTGGADTESAEEDLASADPVERCTTVALERDADQGTETTLELVASGTYGGQDAVLVVLRRFGDAPETFEVFAYDPADCTLLDRATVRR